VLPFCLSLNFDFSKDRLVLVSRTISRTKYKLLEQEQNSKQKQESAGSGSGIDGFSFFVRKKRNFKNYTESKSAQPPIE